LLHSTRDKQSESTPKPCFHLHPFQPRVRARRGLVGIQSPSHASAAWTVPGAGAHGRAHDRNLVTFSCSVCLVFCSLAVFELPDQYIFERDLGKGAYGYVCSCKDARTGEREWGCLWIRGTLGLHSAQLSHRGKDSRGCRKPRIGQEWGLGTQSHYECQHKHGRNAR
jgi:hypothetical protein